MESFDYRNKIGRYHIGYITRTGNDHETCGLPQVIDASGRNFIHAAGYSRKGLVGGW